MAGKLIFEMQSEQWPDEVVALLSEDRTSLFVEDGVQLGSTIVGSSLNQVRDPEAKALFAMLAVSAEEIGRGGWGARGLEVGVVGVRLEVRVVGKRVEGEGCGREG